MKELAVIYGAIIGLFVGMFALGMGSHGGDAWPALVFCGPAYILAAPMGDSLGFAWGAVIGTSLLYAAYGWSLCHFRSWKVLLTIAVVHAPFALLSLVL